MVIKAEQTSPAITRTGVRETGIPVIGNVPWGTHLCHFYRSREDLVETLLPYFRTGLENNEFCLCITSPPLDSAEAQRVMREAVPDFAQYLERGQVEIVGHTEWYFGDRPRNIEQALNPIIDRLNRALTQGYDGIRVASNMGWLKERDWRGFTELEGKIGDSLRSRQIMDLCSHRLDKVGASHAIDMINRHDLAIIRQEGEWELVQGSEHRKMEKVLRELDEERQYRVLFEGTLDGMFVVDAQTMEVLLANDAAAAIFGVDSAEVMVGQNLFSIIHIGDRERIVRVAQQDMLVQDFHRVKELGAVTKDGREIWISALGTRIAYQGRLAGLVSIRDITERRRSQEALQAAEQEQLLLMRNTGRAMIVMQNVMLKAVNAKATEISGYSERELTSKPFTEFIHPDDRQAVTEEYLKKVKGEDVPPQFTFRLIGKEGNTIRAEVAAFLFSWEGRPAVWCILDDITERQQAAEAEQRQQRRFQALIENASDAIIVVNGDGTVRYESPSYERISGFKAEEHIGTDIFRYVHPEDRNVILNSFAQLLQNPGANLHVEPRIQHRDGTWRTVEVTGTNLLRDPAVEGIVVNLRDITDRRRVEQDLRDSEKRYRLLAENISDAIWVADMNLRFTYLSPSWVRLTGYSVEEGMASRMDKCLTPASVEAAAEAFAKAAASQGKAGEDGVPSLPSLELEMVRKDGSTIWLEAAGSFILDSEGRPVEMVGILRDITQRRRAEETLRASEEKFRLLTEKTGDIIWTLDLSLRTTYVSPSIEKVLGFTPEERLSQDPQMQMTPESFARVQVLLCAELERERERSHGLDPERTVKVEVEYYHKNGSTVWLENLISGIRDAKGTLLAYTAYRVISPSARGRRNCSWPCPLAHR